MNQVVGGKGVKGEEMLTGSSRWKRAAEGGRHGEELMGAGAVI